MRTYNLFISHSWTYSDAYKNLVKLLEARSYFRYSNYSVPKDDPLHTSGTNKELYAAIKRKISPCSVVFEVPPFIQTTISQIYSKFCF